MGYFDESFLSEVAVSSNLYSQEQNPNSPFKLFITELKQFLGIVIYMILAKLGATRQYRSKHLSLDFVSKTMTLDKFEANIR